MSGPLKVLWQPELRDAPLIVGWSVDASNLGARVTDYLNRKLQGQGFCDIEPADFFPLSGVAIEDSLVQFPESRFYACPQNNLALFSSDPPGSEWYRFLSLILDVAESYVHTREIYTIGGMVSVSAHTTPRQLVGTFNSAELKETLSHYDIVRSLDFETPPGQRPTLNSFLLWAAKRRNIPAASLWIPVPFYLVGVDDPKARRRVLEFFNQRLDLRIDLSDLDEEIAQQNQAIAGMRSSFPEIDAAINRLESNLGLSVEENQKLIEEMEKLLKGKGA